MASASVSVSSVSVQKPSASTNSEASSDKQNSQRRKSSDTVCSSNSSCFLQKRKAPHPFTNSAVKVYAAKTSGNTTVRQRVLSARLLKLRSVQSQLNDANFHLFELAKENRALKTLQKRQDKALLNYEGVNAELPRLIKSHEEEIRVLRERNKTLRRGLKEAAEHLKTKEEELAHVREQLQTLTALAKDKHLGERGKLAEELEDVKSKLSKSETQINLLNRKLMLESKNYKFRLNAEILKNREAQKQLAQALSEIGKLAKLVEGKPRSNVSLLHRKTAIGNKRQSISLISLGGSRPTSDSTYSDTFTAEELSSKLRSTSDIKLEPIASKKDFDLKPQEMFSSASENIKARLSAKKERERISHIEETNDKFEHMHIGDESDSVNDSQQKSIYTLTRPTSSAKLEKIKNSAATTLSQEEESTVVDQKFGDYCKQVISNASTVSSITDQRREDYEASKTETEKLINVLKTTDEVNLKLKKNSISDVTLPDKEIDIINKIWSDEMEFQEKNHKRPSEKTKKAVRYLSKTTDRNGNVSKKDGAVSLENKKKLLATLKAIDNGDIVDENVETLQTKKSSIMNELFGDLNRV